MDQPDDRALLDHLRLARAPGVGPRTARALREALGSVAAIFAGSPDGLIARGVPERIARALHDPGLMEWALSELAMAREARDTVVGVESAGYPELLARIHDPPPVLTVRGELTPEDGKGVAVVGARRATGAGLVFAHELAHDLALGGLTVVSGLARGIDQAAHEGAMAAGGRTIAVLGAGLRCPMPAAARIAGHGAGAVVSEFAPRETARRHAFPRRNRVIVGLSLGVVVVQAGARSGALITADLAQDEGRDLFAVPGWPGEPLSRGPNGLLRDGAHVVEHADDVLDVLLGVRARREPGEVQVETEDDVASLAAPEARLLRALGGRPRGLEELLVETGLGCDAALVALGRLEISGRVERAGGGYIRPSRRE